MLHTLSNMLMGGGAAALNVEDVFATSLYPGNGSTQTITNGIDLLGEGGLVWVKVRAQTYTHVLEDTVRGAGYYLRSQATAAEGVSSPTTTTITAFNGDGFSIGDYAWVNAGADTYASWTFRQAPRFFRLGLISHTNGVATHIDLSSLGTIGMAVAKITTTTGDWLVWHRSLSAGNNLRLNTTAAQSTSNAWLSVAGKTLTISASAPSGTYHVQGYAHDTEDAGLIQCVSFTTDASGNGSVNHGWAGGVQFAMLKAASTTSDWEMYDTARSPGWTTDQRLRANLTNAEDTVTRLSGTGQTISFSGLSASQTYIAMLVRAPD